jgi:hypothetical protein
MLLALISGHGELLGSEEERSRDARYDDNSSNIIEDVIANSSNWCIFVVVLGYSGIWGALARYDGAPSCG